jgi:3-hydroxyisobutyrate dehydrogenase-like beta-hydroxyacid dehydrogenase
MTAMTATGFVGLGAMGSRVAGRLRTGNLPYGTNRTKSWARELAQRDMIWRGTPREVAEAARVVFSMAIDDANELARTGTLAAGSGQNAP